MFTKIRYKDKPLYLGVFKTEPI